MSKLTFTVPMLPPSVNHMHKIIKNPQGKIRKALKKSVFDWRLYVRQAVVGKYWNLPGKIDVVIEFKGCWERDGKVVEADVDNLLKASLDALQDAIGIRDEMVWDITARKVQADKPETIFYIYHRD